MRPPGENPLPSHKPAAGGLRLLSILTAALIAGMALAQAVPAGTVADIRERTAPFGSLCLEGQDCGGEPAPLPAATGMAGDEIYGKFCHTCHDTGLNEAPKLGDAESWAPRLAKGMEALLETTRTGLNLMPVKGLCMTCTDEELQAAIEYMTADAGAS